MLAILATHPIQYQVPIWQHLAAQESIPFEVWYLTSHGVNPSLDPEFGKVLKWDIDLMEGYPYRFVSDPVLGNLGGFWDIGLDSKICRYFTGGKVKAVLVQGWNVRACWEAVFAA